MITLGSEGVKGSNFVVNHHSIERAEEDAASLARIVRALTKISPLVISLSSYGATVDGKPVLFSTPTSEHVISAKANTTGPSALLVRLVREHRARVAPRPSQPEHGMLNP